MGSSLQTIPVSDIRAAAGRGNAMAISPTGREFPMLPVRASRRDTMDSISCILAKSAAGAEFQRNSDPVAIFFTR
jgi:hypothetical protein